MKRLGLLALAAISSVATVSAEELWIIKDGELNEVYQQMESDPTTADYLEFGDECSGVGAAKFTHSGGSYYNDVKIDMTKSPLDLTKTWVMHIEYSIPEIGEYAEFLSEDFAQAKKPCFIFGLAADTTSASIGLGAEGADARISINGFTDAIANSEAWFKKEVYVYANPDFKTSALMMLSYCRGEADPEISPAYIKDLYFTDEASSKPIYAEDFTNKGAAIYQDNNTKVTLLDASLFHGGIAPASMTGNKQIYISRLWDIPSDASGVYDCEIYHALKIATGKGGVSIDNIAIPSDMKKLSVKMLVKEKYDEATDAAWAELLDAGTLPSLPISISFDGGEKIALYKESFLEGSWTWNEDVVDVPAGATTCSLYIDEVEGFDYVVDQILVREYVASDVDDFASDDASAVVYPSVATDVVTVAVEASKVEVVSLAGAVLATANGNSINVSSLASGNYLVYAYTADGIVVGRFIKK